MLVCASAVSFIVQCRQGQSTIVLSSTITLGDAIQADSSLKQELNSSQSLDFAGDLSDEPNEHVTSKQAILYILRSEIAKIEPPHYYRTPSEVSLQTTVAFVPQTLQQVVL